MVENNYYPLTASINYQPVVCVDGFITIEDISKINDQINHIETHAALTGTAESLGASNFEEHRISTHRIRKSNISFLYNMEWKWLYDKLVSAVNHVNVTNYQKTLYGISPLQYSEYDSAYNGFYGPHTDIIPSIKDGLTRSLSFSLQLTDGADYVGGEVKVYKDDIVYVSNKQIGSITFFDSSLLHEVVPVTSGFRKSLVGWVVGPRV